MSKLAKLILLSTGDASLSEQVERSKAEGRRLRVRPDHALAAFRESKADYRRWEAKHRALERRAYGLPADDEASPSEARASR